MPSVEGWLWATEEGWNVLLSPNGLLYKVSRLVPPSALTWTYQWQHIFRVLCCQSCMSKVVLLTWGCKFSSKLAPILTET